MSPSELAALRIFERASHQRLSAAGLTKKLATIARATADGEFVADRAVTALIEAGLISSAGGAKDGEHPRRNALYRLTDKGRERLRPPRPDLADALLEAQEAFLLLQVFRSKEQALTRSALNAKLKTRAAVAQLEFDVKSEPAVIDYHLASLVAAGTLVEHRRGISVGYELDPTRGTAALASARQHDGVTFTMTGETLNALLAAARGTAPALAEQPEEVLLADSPSQTSSPSAGRTVEQDDIQRYIAELEAGRYAGKDLIPIAALRHLVKQHHGGVDASHDIFDPLVKRMRSDGLLRMIAISDLRDATSEELEDSIPGLNEIIFYLVVR